MEGSLRAGDEILEVNGRELILMTHVEVVSLLKDLPIFVEMVCARSLPSAKFCANNNIVSVNNNNNVTVVESMWDHTKSMTAAVQPKDRSDVNHSQTDRLVKAKSDGSLAIGISSSGPALTLTDDASRIRSRSLEPLTGLAMWSSEPLLIQLSKGERGLGFSILDYQVLFIRSFFQRLLNDVLFVPGSHESKRDGDRSAESSARRGRSNRRSSHSRGSTDIREWHQFGERDFGPSSSGVKRCSARRRPDRGREAAATP